MNSPNKGLVKINIQGIQKTSLVDFEPHIVMTVFLGGCNFRCGFCHNPDIVHNKNSKIDEKEVFNIIDKRKKVLDGVCITGGEPCMHQDLIDFIKRIKDKGLKVKLDTNGHFPDMVKNLIGLNLIDYVAMDIKAPLNKYDKVAGVRVNIEKIKRSIEILKNSNIEYEFRTTVIPEFDEEDFENIGKMLKGTKKYSLQQFSPDNAMDDEYKKMQPKTIDELKQYKKILNKYIKNVEIKNI